MKTTLYIQNLKCGGCETSIINKLTELKGISNISIKFQYSTVTFEYQKAKDIETVMAMLKKMGYPPYGEKNTFGKKAKSYISCAKGRTKN